jgi:hypothetical protein
MGARYPSSRFGGPQLLDLCHQYGQLPDLKGYWKAKLGDAENSAAVLFPMKA